MARCMVCRRRVRRPLAGAHAECLMRAALATGSTSVLVGTLQLFAQRGWFSRVFAAPDIAQPSGAEALGE